MVARGSMVTCARGRGRAGKLKWRLSPNQGPLWRLLDPWGHFLLEPLGAIPDHRRRFMECDGRPVWFAWERLSLRLAGRRARDRRLQAPMSLIESYRAHAAAERAAAAKATLPNRRAMHERAALTWESMAASAEDTAARTQVNEAAKAAQ